jgi:hypothetical protein
MSRFSILVSQATLAIVLAILAIASFFTTVLIPVPFLSKNKVLFHFYEGRARLFWIQSASLPLQVTLMGDGPDMRIEPYYPWPALPEALVGVDIPREGWFRTITIGGYRNVPALGGGWRAPLTGRSVRRPPPAYSSFVRVPAWVPCVLLLYAPIRAVFRGKRERHRKRNNLCETCGYVLHALTEPRCPECGTFYRPAGTQA